MSFFPSLGPDAAVRNAITLNPEPSRLLIAFHTAVLRAPRGAKGWLGTAMRRCRPG